MTIYCSSILLNLIGAKYFKKEIIEPRLGGLINLCKFYKEKCKIIVEMFWKYDRKDLFKQIFTFGHTYFFVMFDSHELGLLLTYDSVFLQDTVNSIPHKIFVAIIF